MRAVFAPQARAEFEEIRQYYDRQKAGLGDAFAESARQGLRRVFAQPLSCPVEVGVFRRLVLKQFPYKLMYSVEADYVYVVAVAHQRQAQNYWHDRIPGA